MRRLTRQTLQDKQGKKNVETLGDTRAKMMTKALDDIMARKSEQPDTW